MAAQKNVRIRTEMAKAGINQIELANILGISDSWQYVVKGGVLLAAVIFDVVSSRKNNSK